MKASVKYGLILAGINFLWILFLFILGLSHSLTGLMLAFIPLIFSIIFCVLSIKNQRTADGGYIEFGKAFKTGFITLFIAGLTGIVFNFIYTKFIDPTYLEYMTREVGVQIAEKFGAPESELDKVREKMEQTPLPGYSLWEIIKNILATAAGAALISVIVAAIVKKPNPDPFAGNDALDNPGRVV